MSCILWLELEGFYQTQQPPNELPLLITRDRAVLDANAAARKRGVLPGMPLRQAKAIVLQCRTLEWKEEDYEARSREWLDVCTRFSGVIEPVNQHAAAVDLTRHPDPLDIAEQLIQAVSSKSGPPVRYGRAPSKWIAQLSALRQDLGLAQISPIDFLAPLPVEDLLPIPIEVRERLAFLGYATIGQVAELPIEVLKAQFGQSAWTIHKASRGELYEGVSATYPKASLHDSLFPQGPLEDLEAVDACLRSMASVLGSRLVERGLEGCTLSVSLDIEDSEPLQLSRRFTKPFDGPLAVIIGIRLLLEGKIDGAVVGLRASLADLRPRRSQQAAFRGLITGRPKADSAIQHVQQVFGENAVVRASDIAVPRRIRVLREWQRATGWY